MDDECMTLEEYIRRLQALSENAANMQVDRIIVPNAMRLLGNIKNRIQRQGEKSDGSEIGQYSMKPFYASKEQFVKKGAFKPVGKKGKQTKKTMYLQHGYKQLRDIQGRPTDRINLTYSTDLMADYKMAQENKRILLGFTDALQVRKRKGLEKRFGTIFSATEREMSEYKKGVEEELKQLTIRTINGTN